MWQFKHSETCGWCFGAQSSYYLCMLLEKFFTWGSSKFSYFLYAFQVPNSSFLIFLYKYSNKHSMFSHYMFVMLLFLRAIISGDDRDGWSLIIQDPTLGNLVEFALNLSNSCTRLNEWMNQGEASAGSTANKIGQDVGWQMCSKLHLHINVLPKEFFLICWLLSWQLGHCW